jgi:GNAT superfamily N-acetyltransferase
VNADPISCERADATGIDTLLDFIRAYYAFDAIAFDADVVRPALLELLANEAYGGAWLIRQSGTAIGYFVLTFGFDLEFGGRQATVTELFVRADARGRGAGRAALEFIEKYLRRLGIGALELQVERDNAEARAFYERLGFEAHDRVPLSKRIG